MMVDYGPEEDMGIRGTEGGIIRTVTEVIDSMGHQLRKVTFWDTNAMQLAQVYETFIKERRIRNTRRMQQEEAAEAKASASGYKPLNRPMRARK